MFRINRNGINGRYSRHSSTNIHSSIKRTVGHEKKGLKRVLSDSSKLTKKITTEKINSFKRLTKQNIQEINNLKKIKEKQLKKINVQQSAQTNKNYNHVNLPKIPEYKAQNIQQLPVRKIQTQEDMAKLFNTIMNGDTQPEKNNITNAPHLNNLGAVQGIIEKQKKINLTIDYDKIVDRLKAQILNQNRINYIQYIQIAKNLKQQFPKNNMIKSIILRSLDRYNRQQYYKIPDDKLKDVVSIILQQIQC